MWFEINTTPPNRLRVWQYTLGFSRTLWLYTVIKTHEHKTPSVGSLDWEVYLLQSFHYNHRKERERLLIASTALNRENKLSRDDRYRRNPFSIVAFICGCSRFWSVLYPLLRLAFSSDWLPCFSESVCNRLFLLSIPYPLSVLICLR